MESQVILETKMRPKAFVEIIYSILQGVVLFTKDLESSVKTFGKWSLESSY